MDLIKIEIEQLKQQIEILDAIFDTECTKLYDYKQVSFCDKQVSFCAYASRKLKLSIKEYYESILHKLGYCKGKGE